MKEDLEKVYGVTEFPFENLLCRTQNTDKKRGIYFVNDALRGFLQVNLDRFFVVNAGVRLLQRVEKIGASRYRLAQDVRYGCNI
jgi:hypothetical protein